MRPTGPTAQHNYLPQVLKAYPWLPIKELRAPGRRVGLGFRQTWHPGPQFLPLYDGDSNPSHIPVQNRCQVAVHMLVNMRHARRSYGSERWEGQKSEPRVTPWE